MVFFFCVTKQVRNINIKIYKEAETESASVAKFVSTNKICEEKIKN